MIKKDEKNKYALRVIWTNVAQNAPYKTKIEQRVASELELQAGGIRNLKLIYDSACRSGWNHYNFDFQELSKYMAVAKFNSMPEFKESERNAAEFEVRFTKEKNGKQAPRQDH